MLILFTIYSEMRSKKNSQDDQTLCNEVCFATSDFSLLSQSQECITPAFLDDKCILREINFELFLRDEFSAVVMFIIMFGTVKLPTSE